MTLKEILEEKELINDFDFSAFWLFIDGSILDIGGYILDSNEEPFKGTNATEVWFGDASDIPPGAITTALTRGGRYPTDEKSINDFDFSAICIEFDKSSARFFIEDIEDEDN